MTLRADIAIQRSAFAVEAELEAAPGEIVVVVGPNGAGKSTVIDGIAGLLPLERGRVELGDRIVSDAASGIHVEPRDRRMGVVFQNGLLFPHMTVEENVAFGPRSHGASKSEATQRARREMERVDLQALAGSKPHALSGGERQRCALARALATDPEALLLDEPFGALDVSSRVEVRRSVHGAVADLGAPTVIVTHDPVEAMAMADRIVVMGSGSVVQAGSPDEIRARPRSRYVGDLVGLNVLRGSARGSILTLYEDMVVTLADPMEGDAIATFHPHAVSLHPQRPEGSMRNVWQATVRYVEAYGDRMRVGLDRPHGVAADVTPAAAEELTLTPGLDVWASLKATEIEAFPA